MRKKTTEPKWTGTIADITILSKAIRDNGHMNSRPYARKKHRYS